MIWDIEFKLVKVYDLILMIKDSLINLIKFDYLLEEFIFYWTICD